MPPSRDLFDDTSMTFGEHLEVLRVHIIRALLGLVLTLTFTLYYGEALVRVIRQPIDDALNRQKLYQVQGKVQDDVSGFDFWQYVGFSQRATTPSPAATTPVATSPETSATPATTTDPLVAPAVPTLSGTEPAVMQAGPSEDTLGEAILEISAHGLLSELHAVAPEQFAKPAEELRTRRIRISAQSEAFREVRITSRRMNEPVTLNVQEAFLTYMKVAFVGALVFASPWIIYQLWLFVASGLYPHERKYVYIYLPSSIVLFLGGALFCFYGVFPNVLDFLLGYNARIGLTAQIRISEWISFAVLLPLIFGLSFQLPLVMLFINKLGIIQVADYRSKRRIAIFVIAVISMVLTPTPDPMTMFMMMAPLYVLYELGIVMCQWTNQPVRRAAI